MPRHLVNGKPLSAKQKSRPLDEFIEYMMNDLGLKQHYSVSLEM
jgi:hypothetical protein